MIDLYIGVLIMTFLAGAIFALTMIASRRSPMWVVDGMAAVVVVGIAVYARWVWEDTLVGELLPFSNLIVVSNWFPLAAAMLSGLVWRRIGDKPAKFLGLGSLEVGSRPRKLLAAAVLFTAGEFSMIWPILGSPPVCGNDWQGDICMQTTSATCSPAAAATLLQNYGIYATEQEMAVLCLTRRGTSWKGLFRGLALKGASVGRRAEVVDVNVDELIADFSEPCILQCELEVGADPENFAYQMEGWIPGQPHSLVLLDIQQHSQVGEVFWIADPSQDMPELWLRENLVKLWHGQILRLIPRARPATNRED